MFSCGAGCHPALSFYQKLWQNTILPHDMFHAFVERDGIPLSLCISNLAECHSAPRYIPCFCGAGWYPAFSLYQQLGRIPFCPTICSMFLWSGMVSRFLFVSATWQNTIPPHDIFHVFVERDGIALSLFISNLAECHSAPRPIS